MSTSIERATICWYTDPAESFLVGTKDSLRQLAHDILNQLDNEYHENEIGNVKIKWSNSENPLTECGMDVVLDGLGIVDSEEDKNKLVNELRVLNNILPNAEE